ncbi:MAG: co-chaperone GroES [Candidatus Doudnabacteria bacterium]|nr:co-chaperone GroES [Candidatus Doudnabacteria bacterium]
MNVKPLGNRVMVKQSSMEEVTKSGIVLPDTADKEKKAQGKIVALGNGDEISALGLKVGDTVVFGKYAGDEIEVEESGIKVEYKILYVGKEKDDSDILALVE